MKKKTIDVEYKNLSLRPYPGEIRLFSNLMHMRAFYEHKTGERYPYEDSHASGRFVRVDGKTSADTLWLIYARRPHVMAHEFAHVLLHLFREIGSDPADGNGEPFCYMLSQLMLDAA
jgi:hypothetical protein